MTPTSITSIATVVKGISTALGIIGGMLGAYTFIDTYALPFKPRFIIGDRAYLVFSKNKANYTYLSSLIIRFDIFNHRNKLGLIEDVFVRIYDSRQLEAAVLDLFPIANLEELPVSREDVISATRLSPASLAIPNKSSKTMILEMAQEKLHHGSISSSAYLQMEALYKNPKGKWKKFARVALHPVFEESSTHGDVVVYNFSLTDRFSEREKLKRKRVKTKVHSYKGLANLYISRWIGKAYWTVVSRLRALPTSARYAMLLFVATLTRTVSEHIEWPITRNKAATKRPFKITVGNAGHAQQTALFFSEIRDILKHKIDHLNSLNDTAIELETGNDPREFIVKKGEIKLNIYIGGDGFIGVHQSSVNSTKGEMIFTLKIAQYPFDRFIWNLSGKPVFATTVATRILDYLALVTLR